MIDTVFVMNKDQVDNIKGDKISVQNGIWVIMSNLNTNIGAIFRSMSYGNHSYFFIHVTLFHVWWKFVIIKKAYGQ